MLDLMLASAHHLAVFGLVAIFAAEFALLRPGLDARRLALLGRIDGAYGALAGVVVVVGILRVIFGAAGAGYYLVNCVFWMKMAAFVIVGLLSIPPTLAIIRWRKALASDAGALPTGDEIASIRRYLQAEASLLLAIPVLAAAMARGFGV